MNAKRWLAALGAVLLIDIGIGLVLLMMSLEENCNNGIARWQCSESLKDLLGATLIAISALYVTALVVCLLRAAREVRPQYRLTDYTV